MAFVSDDIWENIPGPGESLGLRLGLALHWLTPLYSSLVIGIGTYFLGEVTKTGMTGAAKDLDGAVTFVAFLLGLWSPVGHVRSGRELRLPEVADLFPWGSSSWADRI